MIGNRWVVRWLATFGPALLFALAGCTTGRQARPALQTYLQRLGFESIALERDNHNHLLAPAELNGKRRLLLVDTGWSLTTVDRSVGRKLPTLGELSGGVSDPRMARFYGTSAVLVASLKLGGAVFTNQAARVESLRVNSMDGVLGCDFLLRHHGVIDCLDQRLYLRDKAPSPELQGALEATLRRSGFHPVKLDLQPSLVSTCNAQVNGLPVKLVVDTGAQTSIFDSSQVPRLGLKPVGTRVTIFGAVDRIHPARLAVADIKALELNGLTLTHLHFGVAAMGDWGIRASGWSANEVQGVLGGYDLALAGALIDCEHFTLWLKPVGK